MNYYRVKIQKLRKNQINAFIYYQELSFYRLTGLIFFFLSLAGIASMYYGTSITPNTVDNIFTQNTFLLYKILGSIAVLGLLLAFYFHPKEELKIHFKNNMIYTFNHNTLKNADIKKIVVRPNKNKFYVSALLHNYEIPLSGVVSKRAAIKIALAVSQWLEQSQHTGLETPKKPQYKKF